MSSTAAEIYQHDHFLAQRQVFKLLGAAFRLKTADGRLLAYSKQKAFKLREDIRVYSDEAQTVELLHIRADRIIDFSAGLLGRRFADGRARRLTPAQGLVVDVPRLLGAA